MTNAIQATGNITIVDNSLLQDGVDTLTVGGQTYTFVAGSASSSQIHIGTSAALTAANIAIRVSTDSASTFATGAATLASVALTAVTAGILGNSISLSSTALVGALTVTAFAGGLDATDTSYATTAELRVRIDASGATSETWLQQLLNSASVLVDRSTRGYRAGYEAFAESASEVRYFDDNVMNGYLFIDDALTVSSITRDGVTVTPTAWKLYPYNRGQGPAERVYLSITAAVAVGSSMFYGSPFARTGAGTFALTGTWGYCTAANRPPCVKEATLRQAELWYEAAQLGPSQLSQMLVNPFTSLRADIDAILRPVKHGVMVG